jgi:hypothetical protein
MEKIQQLRVMPKKELSGLQLIQTFIERRIQPLAKPTVCGITPIFGTRRESLPTN